MLKLSKIKMKKSLWKWACHESGAWLEALFSSRTQPELDVPEDSEEDKKEDESLGEGGYLELSSWKSIMSKKIFMRTIDNQKMKML